MARSIIDVDSTEPPAPCVCLGPRPLGLWTHDGPLTLGRLLVKFAHGNSSECTHTSFTGRPRPGRFRLDFASLPCQLLYITLSEKEYIKHKTSEYSYAARGDNSMSERGTVWKSLLFDIDLTLDRGYIDIRVVQKNGWSILSAIQSAVRECFPTDMGRPYHDQASPWFEAVVTSACGLAFDSTTGVCGTKYKTSYTITFKHLCLHMTYHEPIRKHVVEVLGRLFGPSLCGMSWGTKIIDPAVMKMFHSNRSLWHDKIVRYANTQCPQHQRRSKSAKKQQQPSTSAPKHNTFRKCTCQLRAHKRPSVPFALLTHDGLLQTDVTYLHFVMSTVAFSSITSQIQNITHEPQVPNSLCPISLPTWNWNTVYDTWAMHARDRGNVDNFNADPGLFVCRVDAESEIALPSHYAVVDSAGTISTKRSYTRMMVDADSTAGIAQVLYPYLTTTPDVCFHDQNKFRIQNVSRCESTYFRITFVSGACRCLVEERRHNNHHVHNSERTFVMLTIVPSSTQLRACVGDHHCRSHLEGKGACFETILLTRKESCSIASWLMR